MITISVERGLVRLKSWEDMLETPGFRRDIDPKHVQLKEIIGVYAFDTKQPCGLKSCRQPHGNGYLVTTTDGLVTNIGNVCGRKNFSVAFIQLQKIFDKDFRAKERRERLESLKSRIPGIIGLIEELKSEAGPLYTAIRHLSGDSGSLPRVVVEAVRNMRRAGDGAVVVSRKATQAERELAIATGNARQGAPYYVSDTIGRLSNIGAVSGASELRNALSEIEPALRRLEVAEIDSISDKEARKIDRVTTGLDSQLDRLRQLVESAKAFVNKENISQLEVILESQTDKKIFQLFLSSLPNS